MQISANEKFAKIVEVLRQKTKSEQVVRCQNSSALIKLLLWPYLKQKFPCCPQFVYLKESFCPSLDEKISVLYEVGPSCQL